MIILVVVLLVVFLSFGRTQSPANIQTDLTKIQDIKKTVLTTGEVVSSTDLSLSFQTSGVVSTLNVKEGDQVKAGDALATLNQGAAWGALQSAQGALQQAQANYNKILAAATAQDVAVSQTTLNNAKQNLEQELTLALNNSSGAVYANTNSLFTNPQSVLPQFQISGATQDDQFFVDKVNAERVGVNNLFLTWKDELTSVSDSNLEKTANNSLAHLNQVHTFLADLLSLVSNHTQGASTAGGTAISSAQTAVTAAKATVDAEITALTSDINTFRSAQSALVLKQAPSRPEDVSLAQAQVTSAEGQVATAQAAFDNTIIRAPMDGTITQVDIKLGQQAQMGVSAIKLQNVTDLHAEADVSEADIVAVGVGQTIDYTFDALGPDKHFSGKVLTVNPASTVISGVVNYKVTGSFDAVEGIKPGMTANMTVLVDQRNGVLVVPGSAVINKNGGHFVRVIDDPKKKTYHEVSVTTGLEADAGLTEITSGLNEGQEVVTFIK